MENSMLKSIKEWASKNNWPFPTVIYKIDKNFPAAFHDLIINYIKTSQLSFEEKETLDKFAIVFTPDHNIYLEFFNNRNRVIILEDQVIYNVLPPAKLIKEKTFLNDLKHLDNKYLEKFISTMPEEYKKRLGEITTLDNITENITKNILDYLDYLVKEKQQPIERISFIEANSVKNRVQSSNDEPKLNQQRKHPEISLDERKKILDSYDSEYEFEANSSNTKSIYKVKVYKVKNIKYKIIMEPKEGTKYTKVVHLNKTQLSQAEIKQIVIDSLELDRSQISQTSNITRHLHTDLEEYKKLVKYLLGDDTIELNYRTKKGIEEAENTKTR